MKYFVMVTLLLVLTCSSASDEELEVRPLSREQLVEMLPASSDVLAGLFIDFESENMRMEGYRRSLQSVSDEKLLEYIKSYDIDSFFTVMRRDLDAFSLAFFYGRLSAVQHFLEQDWDKAPKEKQRLWSQQLCDNFDAKMFSAFRLKKGFREIILEDELSQRCLQNQALIGNVYALSTLLDFIEPNHSVTSSLLQVVTDDRDRLDQISDFLKTKLPQR